MRRHPLLSFAAAEAADPAAKAQAISLVLAGGVVAAIIGPEVGQTDPPFWSRDGTRSHGADGGRGPKPTATCPSREMMITFEQETDEETPMPAAPQFRAETRAWLEANCPPAMRTCMPENEQVAGGKRAKYVRPEQKQWLDRMAAKGWTAPTWPKQYGGGGLSNDEALILEEEMQDLGCRPPLRGMGLSMLGPVLLEYGTEEQRQTHLPPIIRGEIRWCQGYSEPEAGSDLASLRTRAVLQGEHFLVNGHKIWTSNAHKSDWIFCLVRTDPDGEKA